MNDRDYKKWRPFNSVVSDKYLKNREVNIRKPLLSCEKIDEMEEKLKTSLVLEELIEISYIENNCIKSIKDYVIKLDSIYKDVYLKTKKINFRQIIDIK